MDNVDFKPVKTAFIIRKTALSLLIFIAVLITVALVFSISIGFFFIGLAALPLIVLAAGVVINAYAAYKKQVYSFGDRAIYFKTGSLVTDRETELKYKNITHVRLIKPFIEYRLFGTGRVLIEAAGSSGTEVYMQSIHEPEEAYEQIKKIMAAKGFGLSYGNLLSREKPAKIAVILEVVGGIFGTAVFLFIVGINAGVPLSVFEVIPWSLLLLITIPVLLLGAIYVYAMYQDLIRRTYYIYNDVISYNRGFLTKQKAFIPVENLSDSELTQTFLDKVLGLYDVVISCQGGGSEIAFKNLRAGKEVERVIDGLINETKEEPEGGASQTESENEKSGQKSNEFKPVGSDVKATPQVSDAPVMNFKMHLPRVMAKYILMAPAFIFFPLLILPLSSYVIATRTSFKLTANGVASYFTFLSTKNVEFSRDKITGLIIKRYILDRLFSTCTVIFWSIGSDSTVEFKHIKHQEGMEKLMRDKAGILNDEKLEEVKPQFSLWDMFAANLYGSISGFILLAASLVGAILWHPAVFSVVAVILLGYALSAFILHRRYKRATLRLGGHTVVLRLGWLIERTYYALYDNVKDISITNYPLSSKGRIQFNIAGERLVKTNNSSYRVPNNFKIDYIKGSGGNVDILDNLLDLILVRRPAVAEYGRLLETAKGSERVIKKRSRPAIKNSMAILVPVHIIVPVLFLLLPVSVIVAVVRLRKVSYVVEDYRVLKRHGVIYRRQTSIVFPRLDYIKSGQRFLNKIFKNGNLDLYTTGSSSAELKLYNMPDYQDFHEELKNRYEE